MTRNRKLWIAGALSAAALAGGAIAADSMRTMGPMRADSNGDGIVSRAEFFTAAETRFRKHDANSDRTLAGDEMRDRRGRFARLDTNNDGRLTFAEEAAGTTARFARLDADRDGKLTPEELGPRHRHGRRAEGAGLAQTPPPPPAPGAGMGLRRIDANGDGRITRDEMRAQADQRFDRLDANRDGAIDQAEMQAMRGQAGQRRPGQGMGRRALRDQGMDDMPPPPPAMPDDDD